jgi:hypothetical protein
LFIYLLIFFIYVLFCFLQDVANELADFLASLGLSSELPKFTKEQLTLDDVRDLTEEDLKDHVGLALGPRRKILKALQSATVASSVVPYPVAMPGVPLPPGMLYNAFLTHDWGKDELGRDNHQTVTRVNTALKSRGVVTWFDSERMEGHIRDKMVAGIDASACVVVFITQRYMAKVGGQDHKDNCKLEFNYATDVKAGRMLAVPMEPRVARCK